MGRTGRRAGVTTRSSGAALMATRAAPRMQLQLTVMAMVQARMGERLPSVPPSLLPHRASYHTRTQCRVEGFRSRKHAVKSECTVKLQEFFHFERSQFGSAALTQVMKLTRQIVCDPPHLHGSLLKLTEVNWLIGSLAS